MISYDICPDLSKSLKGSLWGSFRRLWYLKLIFICGNILMVISLCSVKNVSPYAQKFQCQFGKFIFLSHEVTLSTKNRNEWFQYMKTTTEKYTVWFFVAKKKDVIWAESLCENFFKVPSVLRGLKTSVLGGVYCKLFVKIYLRFCNVFPIYTRVLNILKSKN